MTARSQKLWRLSASGVKLRVRVTARAAKDVIDGIELTTDGPAVAARVRALPADEAANDALEQLFADWLDVPRSTVAVAAGGRSRVKSLEIVGDARRLAERLAARLNQLA